ncbi:MAG TPA: ABC transporter substrate-binding protein [Chloroflexota bacterium]|nr:ABC transporter substrate-binding protein [Chloroflexota bacterium]
MDELTPIAAGYATPAQGAGPMLITVRAGLFEKHGLAVEPQDRGRARSVVDGLMAGELQFGNLAAPSMLRMVLTGEADVVFLALGINQQFLVGRPGLGSKRDLAGARLARSGDGAITDLLTVFLHEQLGREGIGGTTLVPHAGSQASQIDALLRGEYDAVVLTPPAAIEARRRGCHLVVDLAEYGLNYSLGGIAARRPYVAAHPDIARSFIAAYIEGLHRYRTDRAFTVGVLQEFTGERDRSLMETHYDLTMPGMPKAPYPRTDGLATALRIIARDLPAAASADPGDFVDERFVRELDASGFIARVYEES